MSCVREECPGTGMWLPVLVIRAKKTTKAYHGILNQLGTCTMHRDQSTIADFLSAEGWDRIQKFMREAGKGVLTKNLTELDWVKNNNVVPTPKEEEEWLPF